MNGALDISLAQLALSLVLVAVAVAISVWQGLGLSRDLVVGSVRTVVQLFAVGLVLSAVFAAARWYWVALILLLMVAAATQAAVARLTLPLPGAHAIAALALGASTALTLAWVIGVVVQVSPWYDPQYVIPIAGMILGNSMNGAALAGERFQGELKSRAAEVEAYLALGFSARQAARPLARSAMRAGMIPTLNSMMVVGVVQLPGMMTGQILAGSPPLTAIRYQIVVMFMLAAATAVASLVFVRLATARYFTPADQLRRHLIGA